MRVTAKALHVTSAAVGYRFPLPQRYDFERSGMRKLDYPRSPGVGQHLPGIPVHDTRRVAQHPSLVHG